MSFDVFKCTVQSRQGYILHVLYFSACQNVSTALTSALTLFLCCSKRKAESEQEDGRPYVKRPPNAFMLFMKEHRPHVEEDIKKKGNGAVNRVLGQRVGVTVSVTV